MEICISFLDNFLEVKKLAVKNINITFAFNQETDKHRSCKTIMSNKLNHLFIFSLESRVTFKYWEYWTEWFNRCYYSSHTTSEVKTTNKIWCHRDKYRNELKRDNKSRWTISKSSKMWWHLNGLFEDPIRRARRSFRQEEWFMQKQRWVKKAFRIFSDRINFHRQHLSM